MRGDCVVGGALEDRQVLGFRRDERDRLYRRGTGADHGDGSTGEIHLFVRPVAGVVGRAFETVQPLELRRVGRREAARRHYADLGVRGLAVAGFERPAVRGLIERCFQHTRFKLDVAAQIEAVGDVVGVSQDLRLRGIAFAPAPLLLQLGRELVGVLHAFDVAACAWVTVPVPGAADARARLEDARLEAPPAQLMQHVEAGKSRADDNGVEVCLGYCRAHVRSPGGLVGVQYGIAIVRTMGRGGARQSCSATHQPCTGGRSPMRCA